MPALDVHLFLFMQTIETDGTGETGFSSIMEDMPGAGRC